MSTSLSARPYRIYPAYCFHASPTYNAWVKLTAADVQALRSEPGFQGQNLYFHLNHPIRFVRVVGVVVAIDDINDRYANLTIDDGSGATLELKIVRKTSVTPGSVELISNTVIENLRIVSRAGVFEVIVDQHVLDIGTVVKAKGTLSEFRNFKQIELKRIWTVSSTDDEAQAWAETAVLKQNVLSKPWHISPARHRRIKAKIKAEEENAQEYRRRKVEYDIRKRTYDEARQKHRAEREEKLEGKRRKEELMMNTGALI